MHLGDGENTMNKKPALTEIAHSPEPGRTFYGSLSAIAGSRIELAELSAAALAFAPRTELSWWANRSAETDVDHEILAWIASHVRNKRHVTSVLN
jgi:hypothetical protein